MAEQANDELMAESWFKDLVGDGSKLSDQLEDVRKFAYIAFDQIDKDKNGFLTYEELEQELNNLELGYKQRSFIKFIMDNIEQIGDAADDLSKSRPDGVSRADLESYFELIATLL